MEPKMKIVYKTNNVLTGEEIIYVFNSVGWNKNPENIVDAFLNSYYVTAYHNDTLIGFARAISDGHYYTGIYDVIVTLQYQKKGIAKEMMKMLLDKFKGTYFFLSYTAGNQGFYQKCGFENLPNGMWMDREKSFNLNIDNL
ncbi:MAG: GNAT family N-acetyltransferase [Candidatus Cloacimonetes bacterium]|nr:GNAT family N-acetyltransferase [Candidatus Cloacimonadota bacterium]